MINATKEVFRRLLIFFTLITGALYLPIILGCNNEILQTISTMTIIYYTTKNLRFEPIK